MVNGYLPGTWFGVFHAQPLTTNYARLTALRRDTMPFSPTLCFAPHWAELTRPCRAFTVVSVQSFGCLVV